MAGSRPGLSFSWPASYLIGHLQQTVTWCKICHTRGQAYYFSALGNPKWTKVELERLVTLFWKLSHSFTLENSRFWTMRQRPIVRTDKCVSGKPPTYPSPNLTLTLTSHFGKNERGRWAVSQKYTLICEYTREQGLLRLLTVSSSSPSPAWRNFWCSPARLESIQLFNFLPLNLWSFKHLTWNNYWIHATKQKLVSTYNNL